MTTRDEVRQKKERRANVWSQARTLIDDVQAADEDWTAEQDTSWDAYNVELEKLDTEIERDESVLAFEARDQDYRDDREDRTGTPKDQYAELFNKFMRNGRTELDTEERLILAGNHVDIAKRAQSVGVGSQGGYTVPDGFWNRLSETLLEFGGAAEVVNVITTETGQDLPWPTNDDTGNTGAILAENVVVPELNLTFGFRSLGSYTYTSKLIRISWQLLQDTEIDIENLIIRKAGERLARIYNTHLTTGNGANQPLGIVTGAGTGVTTASATAITFNEVIDLIHSVDPAYRNVNRAKFMFSDGVLQYIRKVRDDSGGAGLGRPLWEPSVQVGEPNTIYGFPYQSNQDMAATVAATNTTILFGDFVNGYVHRVVRGNQLVRLEERYADLLQTGFFLFGRMDGTTDDTAAYQALVQKA